MLAAVSPLSNANKDDSQGEMASFSIDPPQQDFPDFSDTNLLDSIDFDDLFEGINDVLPDLEMDDPDIVAVFSVSGGDEESEMNASISVEDNIKKEEEEDKVSGSSSVSGTGSGSSLRSSLNKGEEIVSKREEESSSLKTFPKDADKVGRKSSNQIKNNNNNQGKRKVKVDWTPELHRRFVQAVEQLGVDKAVPSRILELMGIDCLTRHNIASHLQKYRSHRKHLLAREAEAASWSQRRQMYGAAGTTAGGGGKRDMNLWLAPTTTTIGFPPMTPPPMHPHHHCYIPLHVWGHPTMDQSLMHMWPKPAVAHSPSPSPSPAQVPPSWAQPCHPHWHDHHRQQVPNGLTTPGTPCFLQPLATTRFPAPPVPGISPHHHHHAMYKVQPPGIGVPTAQSSPHPIIDCHPSKESIDAAIGDVLTKPWQPLPLGLKPPSMDSVMGELQRQGVPKVPPSCS